MSVAEAGDGAPSRSARSPSAERSHAQRRPRLREAPGAASGFCAMNR